MDGTTFSPTQRAPVRLEIGVRAGSDALLTLDLDRVLAGRCLIQGSSGAGKSSAIRRIVEEAFEYVTVIIVDPEGEFANLAEHIGATTLRAAEYASAGLTAAAARARRHRLPLHLDLTDLGADERIEKAASFFSGLISCPPEDWAHTILVAIDEAHLLAPHIAGSARDAETRRLGVSTLTELCSRGRKRGIAPVIATQRLAKLAASVTSELHNFLIGLNVLDRDVTRAADFLGFTGFMPQRLRKLEAGEFYAFGPALSPVPVLAKIGPTVTRHLGATPEILGPADVLAKDAAELLGLDGLQEITRAGPTAHPGRMARGLIDAFLMDPAAPAAARIVEALRRISPNATSAGDLARHLGLEREPIDAGLDLLSRLGAVDTVPRSDTRIARLSARLRQLAIDPPVVDLS